MVEPLVVVPAKAPRHQAQFWVLVVTVVLWFVQAVSDLAVGYGLVVPKVWLFAGAVAGLAFTGISLVLRLGAPETLSGFDRLDRSTRDATWRNR